MQNQKGSETTEKSTTVLEISSSGRKSFDNQLKEKYESFWLYPESHSWRLYQHITLRGVLTGSTIGFVGAIPFAILRRKGQILETVGRATLRGAVGTGALMGIVAAERLYHLDAEGIADRAYRISYNWGQTKWDYLGLDGALLGMAFLRRQFGGILPATSVGIALGTLFYIGLAVASREPKAPKPETPVAVES